MVPESANKESGRQASCETGAAGDKDGEEAGHVVADDGSGLDGQAQLTRGVSRATNGTFFSSTATTATYQSVSEKVLTSTYFDAFIGLVIVSNSIIIGVGQSLSLQGEDTSTLDAFGHVFLCIYIMELLLRFCAYGPRFALDRWVQFDIVLVVLGVTTEWLLKLPLCGGESCDTEGLGFIMVLRSARLLRLAKTIGFLIQFRELWMLVRGLLDSASTMLYTLLVMTIILYIFTSIGIELITKHRLVNPSNPDYDEEFAEIVAMAFGSVPQSMLTMVQFACLDSVHALYIPLVQKDPLLVVYFLGVILVVSIVLMNLITAVVVNTALEHAMQDKELAAVNAKKEHKKLVHELKKVFVSMDEDKSGMLSVDEVRNIAPNVKTKLEQLLAMTDPLEIFFTLDVNKNGVIDIDEFCDGIWQVVSQTGSVEHKRTERKVDIIRQQLDRHEQFHKEVSAALSVIVEACGNLPAARQPLASVGNSMKSADVGSIGFTKSSPVGLQTPLVKEPMRDDVLAGLTESIELTKATLQEVRALRVATVERSAREVLGSAMDLRAAMCTVPSSIRGNSSDSSTAAESLLHMLLSDVQSAAPSSGLTPDTRPPPPITSHDLDVRGTQDIQTSVPATTACNGFKGAKAAMPPQRRPLEEAPDARPILFDTWATSPLGSADRHLAQIPASLPRDSLLSDAVVSPSPSSSGDRSSIRI